MPANAFSKRPEGADQYAKGPRCSECGRMSILHDGSTVFPNRQDLWEKHFFVCECGARVGCHPGTMTPLGTPAGATLRSARSYLHQTLDPLWKTADQFCLSQKQKAKRKTIQKARVMAYAFLASKLGISRDDCHIGLFDLATCQQARVILRDLTYPQIEQWWNETF